MAKKAQKEGRRTTPNHSLTRCKKGVVSQHHASAVSSPGKTRGPYCTGSWVGLGVGLDGHGKPRSNRDSNLGASSP